MVPKKNRLTKKEIDRIKKTKTAVVQGKYFGLIFLPQREEKKFGVILSTKISKKAVERNRIKRLLFQALEQNPIGEEGWFLFLAKKTSLEAKGEDLVKELEAFRSKLRTA